MRVKVLPGTVLSIIILLLANAASACPFCNSNTAAKIRASLAGPDLAFNVFVTIFPFIIFLVIAWLIYHGGIPRVNRVHQRKESAHE